MPPLLAIMDMFGVRLWTEASKPHVEPASSPEAALSRVSQAPRRRRSPVQGDEKRPISAVRSSSIRRPR